MNENEIARIIVDCAYRVHTTLGPGLLESVYEVALPYVLVENKVVVELKSEETNKPVHKKQCLTCVRLADKRLGLVINFGVEWIKDGITRLVNNLPDTPSSLHETSEENFSNARLSF